MTARRAYSEYTTDAVLLLGQLIKIERRKRRWSEAELAERVGVARETIKRIERGEPTCAVGLAFEAAALLGIPLFAADGTGLRTQLQRNEAMLTLLPGASRSASLSRSSGKAVDDDF